MLDLASNIYKQMPENIDYDNTVKILSVDPSPLNVVLLQEVRLKSLLCLSLYLVGFILTKKNKGSIKVSLECNIT